MVFDEGASWSGRERNHLFLNLGDGSFSDISTLSDADFKGDGRAVAVVDWDDDGRMDLILRSRTGPRLRFLRNVDPHTGHFLALDLRGRTCNKDAVGARVTIRYGGKTQAKTIHVGSGYLCQTSKRLHFGIGDATKVDSLEVRWPDGSTASWRDVPADSRLGIFQGAPQPVQLPPRTAPQLDQAESMPLGPSKEGVVRVPLFEKLPMDPLALPSYANGARRFRDLAGKGPVLVNLWGMKCANCLKEFADFQGHAEAISAAGLRIVPINMDLAKEHGAEQDRLRKFDLPLTEAGYANERFMYDLQRLLDHVIGDADDSPLPSSMLLDGSGQLVALYLGRVDLPQVLADAEALKDMDPKVPDDTRLVDGRRIIGRARDYAHLADSFQEVGLPEEAAFYRALAAKAPGPQ